MGRKQFSFKDMTDVSNFFSYLDNNSEKVLFDLREYHRSKFKLSANECNLEVSKFVSLWKTLSKPSYSSSRSSDEFFEDVTVLLYLLPPARVNTIKVSLRAIRLRSKKPFKTQLTIDKDVYSDLAAFAASEHLTLSDAINTLLSAKNKVIA